MIRLTTLGLISAQIGSDPIPPNNDQILGALLFLVAQRGTPMPRRAFADMFFPNDLAHSGRQLIYRMREIGVPLKGDSRTVYIAEDGASWDVETLLARGTATDAELQHLQRGYLADYRPGVSDVFARWVDEHRDDVVGKLRLLLVRQMQALRARKDFRALGGVAKACLALDPLNEEATLASAESLVAVGAKADAMHLLSRYLEDVGGRSPELQVAPRLLRERISTYIHEPEREPIPLVGRANELATLTSLIEQSAAQNTRACLVSGPGGIGKTRLIEEACRIGALTGHAIAKISLSPHDVDRPFAILRDLGPALLDLKGALGAAPETLAAMRGLCGRGPSQYSRRPSNAFDARAVAADIQRKALDLVDAVSEEQPLVIWIEDADRMDEASRELAGALMDDARSVCVVMASRRPVTLGEWVDANPALARIALQPLTASDARVMLSELFQQVSSSVDETFADNALRIAAGVPLFLHLLFMNYLTNPGHTTLPETLSASLVARLEQLQEPAKSVFDAVVVLGAQCTVALLEAVTELPRYSLMQGLRSLDEQGFVQFSEGTVLPSHDLLADTARARMPVSVNVLLHRSAAQSLETDRSADSLATALHWQACGDKRSALLVLTQGAAAFTSIGRPHEAIRLLTRAREISQGESEQRAIDFALLDACYAASEDHAGLLVAERTGALVGRDTAEHRVMAAEMTLGAGRLLSPLLDQLKHIAADVDLADNVRGRAARLIVEEAENRGDESLGIEALAFIKDVPPTDIETLRPRLIFETVFGSADTATRLAREIQSAAVRVDDVGLKLKALKACSFALWRCGEWTEAMNVSAECFAMAHANQIWSACTSLGSLHGLFACEAGDLATAQEWYERTLETMKRSGGPDRGFQVMSLGIDLALARNDGTGAMAILDQAARLFPAIKFERWGLSYTANWVRIRMTMGIVPNSDEVEELLQGHLARRHLGLQDFVADTMGAAMEASGRSEEARSLRQEYLTRYRKDRYPVGPHYRWLNESR